MIKQPVYMIDNNEKEKRIMIKNDCFFYGTQYYRPPNPQSDQHSFHLNRIKNELGFDLIKVFIEWSYNHTGNDKFDFKELDEIFDICDEIKLNVIIQTRLESAPYWLEKKYPQSRYKSANGNAVELGPNGNTQCGGYPGLCFHNDAVKQEAGIFLKEIARHFRARKSLIGYDCWNEPHLEPAWIDNSWINMGDKLFCYCDATKNHFRVWLKGRYGDIYALNRVWTRRFSDWDEVNPPNRQGHYADWLDWSRFWFDDQQNHMKWRYDSLKRQDPGKFVMSHSGATPPFLPRANAFINNWAFSEPVDIWGTSMAPRYMNWTFADCAGILDITRSAARGKDFWISELTGGSGNIGGYMKSPITRQRDIRSWNWLGVAYGAKAIVYWCYLTESTGLEAGSYGLIQYNGKITARACEAAIQAELIRNNYDLIKDNIIKTDVAILYDPDNSSMLFAMEATDRAYSWSHIGYYRCIWDNDLYARFITGDMIDAIDEKMLIVPMCLVLDESMANSIKNFVQRGGILITEARTGLFDKHGFLQPELPSHGLVSVAGLCEDEALYSDKNNRPSVNNSPNTDWSEEILQRPEIELQIPIDVSFNVNNYLAPLITDSAKCIGKCKDICLIAHNRYGNGEVYYFGTYFGLALYDQEKGAHKLLSKLLTAYTTPKISGNILRPRLIENRDHGLLMVFNNDRNNEHCEKILLPPGYIKANDILKNEGSLIIDNMIEVKVMPEDVTVFRLDK
jgi:beta-galactosidase